MKLKLKQFQVEKIKSKFIKLNICFLFHGVKSTTKTWFAIEKELLNINLNYYKMSNTLLKVLLSKSVLKNIVSSLNGPCFLISISSPNIKKIVTREKLLNVNNLMTFFCLKVNNRIYISNQLRQVHRINYLNNIKKIKDHLHLILLYSFSPFFKKLNLTKD
jgi:hypothetical protein